MKKIKFEYHFDSEYIIHADKTRIDQVISNLIDNSIKSISEQKLGSGEKRVLERGGENVRGTITITIEKEIEKNNNNTPKFITNSMDNYYPQEIIIVGVKDTGTGINKEMFPRLFTKFASKSFQGTGLGLYISKKIIEANGGSMWAENNKEGSGSKFYFSVPLKINGN